MLKLQVLAIVGGLAWSSSNAVHAVDGDAPADLELEAPESAAPLYRTREERREAGRQRQLTPWLTASGLLELEASHDRYQLAGQQGAENDREEAATLQLGLVMDISGLAEVEAVIEYDSADDKVDADEFFLAVESGDWEWSLGRQYTPFGIYKSDFVTGPVLEFGETRADKLLAIAYGPSDSLDLSFSVYAGEGREQGKDEEWDWAVGLEWRTDEGWLIGMSYQSDLADSDAQLLEDEGNRYRKRVAGVSGLVGWGNDRHDVTLEVVSATNAFGGLDRDRNRPIAWNVELTRYLPAYELSVAARLEGSRELEDEPARRWGIAATWQFLDDAALTVEYLHGEFERGFAENAREEPIDSVDQVAARISIGF